MKIETKYSLNDVVFAITKVAYREHVTCEICNGACVVQIVRSNRKFPCPDCCGTGIQERAVMYKWSLEAHGKIGKVQVGLYSDEYEREDETRYMLDTTGVGSGTVWKESSLFLSHEEAQIECDRLNSINSNCK